MQSILQQLAYYLTDIAVDANGLVLDFFWADCLAVIDTGISGFWVFRGHLPKRIFDNDRGVVANAQF
jgi:hypothetical protein